MDPTLKIFLWAVAGALAPEILRLYTIARKGERFTWSPFYLVISLAFAGLGGLMALLVSADNASSAFYAGLGTPVIINTGLKRAGGQDRRNNVNKDFAENRRLSRYDSFVEAL
jgi:hypothetical protein